MRMGGRLVVAVLFAVLAGGAGAIAQEPVTWKAVLVAGDDSVPVFENAVTTLSGQLRQRGVTDIRVLSASPRASRSETRATAGNLDRALKSLNIGANDGCLLYFTSHGSEAGLLMSQDKDNEQTLSPDLMGRILNSYCAGRPAVVVVSACHSGTFLRDGIVADDRIVLTAARKERVSFGCEFRLRYNYFDGCLLAEIDRSATWSDLFGRTRACIERLEAGLNEKPSEPQAMFGERVKNMPLPRAGQ
jgi:hypothetical protein